ncbi:topoisomerase DNA-binding C4 zinc finger domain-containing protein [candidate division KSB1 bacterium]|nr:topoisomerase DNA-binding C4 zinc finger domain-containing protein [candidate division KSB1 bacterium]
MSQSLVIVDSISKYNILQKFLGDSYFIYPGIDIIKDLAGTNFIFKNDDLKPHFLFQPRHKEYIVELKKISELFQNIIIAADPSLSGELKVKCFEHIFIEKKDCVRRVKIYEFTRLGIKQAFVKPVPVNNLLLNSYYTRLAINRLIIHNSNILQKFSVNDLRFEYIMALGLICECEDQIEIFKVEKSYAMNVVLKVNDSQAIFCPLVGISGSTPVIPDLYHAKAVIKDLKKQLFKVKKIIRQQKKINPPAPFTTITLLHEAYKKYMYSLSKTLNNAKELYEGIDLGRAGLKGLITFYHTESNYTPPEAVLKARELIYTDYGAEYLPPKPYQYGKNDPSMGAIRPVDVKLFPNKVRKFLTDEQFNIYSLIWNRFVASQMSGSIEEQTTVDIVSDTENRYELKSLETKVLFRGYKLLDDDSNQYNNTKLNTISNELRKNQILQYNDVRVDGHVSVPVKRYTETGVLQELVSAGRDYFPDLLQTTGTLFANKLIKYHKEHILPTPAGYQICHFVFKYLPNIYNPGFLTKISKELKCIESGSKKYSTVLENFKKLNQHFVLNKPSETNSAIQEKNSTSADRCPVCNSLLYLTKEQNDRFLVCEKFPAECYYAEPVSSSKNNTSLKEKCPNCGSLMVVREGRFGRFLACSKYPKCNYTKAYPIGVKCPQEGCSGEIVEKSTRNGKIFYGCNRYPKCKFASWHKPENILCEHCGNMYMVIKTNGFEKYYQCPKCHKKYDMNVVPVDNNINNKN